MSGMAVATMVPSMEPMNIDSIRVARTSGLRVTGLAPAVVMRVQYSICRWLWQSERGCCSVQRLAARAPGLQQGGQEQQGSHAGKCDRTEGRAQVTRYQTDDRRRQYNAQARA